MRLAAATRAQRAYLLAKLDGEEYKTTNQGRSNVVWRCLDKGFLAQPKGGGAPVVTELGRKAVGR